MTKAKKPAKPAKVMVGTSSMAERKALFVAEYLRNGGNATQAAIAAGYSVKSARSQGSKLLAESNIRQQVASVAAETARIVGLDSQRTLQEVARIAYGDPRKMFNVDGSLKRITDLDDESAAMLAGIDVDEILAGDVVVGTTKKIKLLNKNQALDMAMKYHNHYANHNESNRAVVMVNVDLRSNG